MSAESLQLPPRLVPGLQAPIELMDVGDITSWHHHFSIQGLNNTIDTVLIVLDVETQASWTVIPWIGEWGPFKAWHSPPKKPPNLCTRNGHDMVFPTPHMITYIDPT